MGHDELYWIFSAGIPLVFLLAVFGIVRRNVARRAGSQAAARWFLPLAVATVLFILGQAGYDLLSATVQRSVSMSFFLLMSLFCWALVIHSGWRQRQAGALLLDLGPPESSRRRGILAFILISALLAGRSGLDAARTGFHSPGSLSETLMWVTATLLWLTVLRNRVRITARGIVAFGELIEWERVLDHEWMGEGSQRLLLRVRRQIPLLGARTGLLVLPVAPRDRGALEGILARHALLTRND